MLLLKLDPTINRRLVFHLIFVSSAARIFGLGATAYNGRTYQAL